MTLKEVHAQTSPADAPTVSLNRETGTLASIRKNLQSLEFKAAIWVVILIVSVTATGTLMSARAMRDAFYQSEFAHARTEAQSMALAATPAYEQERHDMLKNTVRAMVKSPTVAYAAFVEPDGRIIAMRSKGDFVPRHRLENDPLYLKIDSLDEPRVIESEVDGIYAVELMIEVPRIHHVNTPAKGFSDAVPSGYMLVATDISPIRNRLQDVNRQLIQLAAILVLLVVPICLATTRYVVAPLNELARTARAIANGSVDERAEVRVGGEIGELAEAFNTMTDRVVSAHMDLLRLNAELEQRVNKRTQELARLAACDPLTGLYNRRHFGEVFHREFAASRRYERDLSCLMFDLDHFKETNDRFGHRTGDEILILVALSIQSVLRETDVAARFGGDEFVAMLSQATCQEALPVAERIRDTFSKKLKSKYPDVPATISIGIASLSTSDATSAEDLIHEADVALYKAKERGRNQVAAAEARPLLTS